MAFESTAKANATKSTTADYVKLTLWYSALFIYRVPTVPLKMKRGFSRTARVAVNHLSGYQWGRRDTLLNRQN